MSESFTRDLKRVWRDNGCRFDRRGRGEHEIWFSPITNRHFVVDQQIKSRHTANAVLEQAGISKKY